MSSRNLTSKSPHIESDSSHEHNIQNNNNPFTEEYEEREHLNLSMDSSSSSSFNQNNRHADPNPFASSNDSQTQMLNPSSKNNNYSGPSEYPQGLSGSRILSMSSNTSLVNHSKNVNKGTAGSFAGAASAVNPINNTLNPIDAAKKHSTDSSNNLNSMYSEEVSSSSLDNGSSKSTNPFLVDTEFSPFGGYPASSFPLHIDEKEADDYLHNPDPIEDEKYEKNRFINDLKHLDSKSAFGLLGFVIFGLGFLVIFVVLPVLTYSGVTDSSGPVVYDTYTVLTDYVYPTLSAIRTNLVDADTPSSAYTREAKDGSLWKLVFSDEFAAEGRTFYPGDDQFWYAPNIHYAATMDLEWYDPDAVTTSEGTATLRMDAYKNHNLYYRSGMLHSWNRLCFTQGIMEVSARLPNYGNITGLWPGIWSMGNLGRPGYMATTDGVWPYSYEACDAGITANQSSPDGISYLPGQRLNSCTCSGEEHPNPGTGRGAPEIDILEGEVDTTLKLGLASQSMQIAPFDIWYMPDYNFVEIHNKSITVMNTYAGGPYQQAVSGVTTLNTTWYQYGEGSRYQKYSYEYLNDDSDGYVRWFVGDDPTLTVYANSLAPNGNIDWRRITKEPMAMVLNLGISNNWAYIDWPSLDFPMTMSIDYVRIYQPNDSISITCDPTDYPTYDYINDHPLAYENANMTSWKMAGYKTPKNSLINGCSK